MGHDLLLHALLLLSLLWLCILFYGPWLRGRPVLCRTVSIPAQSYQTGFQEPKPLPGFVHSPSYHACEHAAEASPQILPVLHQLAHTALTEASSRPFVANQEYF